MARKMKDSGIAWIGEIPEEWAITSIGILFSVKAGGDAKPNFYSTEKNEAYPYPVYTNTFDENQVYAYTNTPQFEENSITVTGRGAVGHAIYRDTKFDAIIRLLVLSPKMELDCRYYTYFIDNVVVFFTDNAAIGQLSAQQICPYKVCWLPVSTQRRIAAFLDEKCAHIDAVIEKTRASIDEYKKLKQAIITRAVTKGLRQGRKMKDNGIEWIGEIPEEWRFVKIVHLLDYDTVYPIGDGDHGLIKPADYADEGVPYIRVQNIGWGTPLLLDNVVYITEEKNHQIQNSTLKPNDILFCKTGATIGKTGIVPSTLPMANTTSHVGKITVSSSYDSKFVFYVLSSFIGYRQFWDHACLKSTRPELTIDEIKSIRVILPQDMQEQQEIAAYLDAKTAAIDRLIAKKEQLIAEMQSCKKSLIYEVVTGKREVAI